MKKLTAALVGASLTAGVASVQAEDIGSGLDLSMNSALTTDYVWRGVSQSNNRGAIQGGMDLSHESGAYIGTWASSVAFVEQNSKTGGSEFDYYLGFANEVGPVSYDVGYLAYTYNEDNGANFSEYYASVGMMGFTLGFNYSDDSTTDNMNGSEKNDSTTYTYIAYDLALEGGLGIQASIGQYDTKDNFGSVLKPNSKYEDYLVGVSYTAVGIDWALTYTDTDLSSSDCGEDFYGVASDDTCGAIFAVSAAKSF